MAENKLPFAEDAFIHRPPMFSGVNNQFLKICMKNFIESIHQGIQDAIMKGPYIPKHVVDNKQTDKPLNQWTKEERKFAQYDYTTKNILTSSLDMNEFFRVS